MNDNRIICIDIGSTWTKAARFKISDDRFVLENKAVVPTTVENLPSGFYDVLKLLEPDYDWQNCKEAPVPVRFSSSAKGGLNVAVVGLVPELTLKIGKIAAYSAGAKITAAFPYKLTRDSLKTIEKTKPDILLLCGGTDGGNERYVRENACALAGSTFSGTIIYAGNQMASDEIERVLGQKKLKLCQNLMPDFGCLNVEPVREAIKEVFLETIVEGKGLKILVDQFGIEPVPTPVAVLNLVNAIGKQDVDWQNFALIDLGGATTDFYSFCESWNEDSGTVLKGINEPKIKRSVEGDLGLRVSSEPTFAAGEDWLRSFCGLTKSAVESFSEYSKMLQNNTSRLAGSEQEKKYDELLADICVNNSFVRHAGTIERVFTTGGAVWAQTGKDLRRIKKVIGTGGYLTAAFHEGYMVKSPLDSFKNRENIVLLPENFKYYVDSDYIFPLLGLLAMEFPAYSARAAISSLTQMQYGEQFKESFYSEIKKT